MLIAQAQNASSNVVFLFMVMALFVVMFVSFPILLLKNYHRCPPNRLLVIYGKGTGIESAAKVVHGGAAFVVPLMQDYAYLSLDPLRLELPKSLHSLATERGVKLPQTWTFAVGTEPESMQNAAVRLIGLPKQEIERLAENLIVGRIEKQLDTLDHAVTPVDSAALLEKWAAEVDRDLAQVGLKTLGYR